MDERLLETMSSCLLFRDIPATEIQRLFSRFPGTTKEYHKGSIIAFRGDDYQNLLILVSGTVSAELHDYSGKTVRIETLPARSAWPPESSSPTNRSCPLP